MKKIVSTNPADNSFLGEVSVTTEAELKNKINKAQAAKKIWKSLGVKKRVEILRPLISAFKNRESELVELTVKEMGKTITETKADMVWDFDYFNEFLDKGPGYIEDEITVNDGTTQHRIVYEPRGVVACIVPWNFPFANFVWGVIPNLIVGNVVIFKHSEECPLIGKLIEDVMASLTYLPEGVFSEVYGGADVGSMLVSQEIDLIWFTGSSAVGTKLHELAGKKFIKSVLELGGSNPAIVFDDVDIEQVIQKIYRGRFTNCGQVCDAIKRLIVHESIYDNVVAKFKELIDTIMIGNPEEEDTQLGPLAAMRQLELLSSQVQDSVNAGAVVVSGGKRAAGFDGAFYSPTILVNVTSDMRVWKEEVFGPVLPIVSFKTEEEAIRLANDTIYGLGAVVHSSDLVRARRVAAALDAGFVDINDGNHWQQCNPFGGYKMSGIGCEHGRLGFQELCLFKVVAEG